MAIPVYRIQSVLSQVPEKKIEAWLGDIEKELGEHFDFCSLDDFAQLPFGLVFISSGGSERSFLNDYPQFADRPCYILTSGHSNSLAASMEILSYLQKEGKHGEILHGTPQAIARRIDALSRANKARAFLKGKRFGVVGQPSDWLIASSDKGDAYLEKLGLSLLPIPMEKLFKEYEAGGYPENEWTEALKKQSFAEGEIEKALNMYGALRRIADEYQLAGLSLRCFDLLDTVCTTGCLGLAILNAQGIYAGCEGDVPSLISMAILGAVSGQPVFMCNPSRIHAEEGTMVLAHCTLPINMPKTQKLMTHYESGIGVAIAGDLPEEACTIFKTDANLDRFFVKEGHIVKNLHEATLCRTQIEIALDDFSYFLTKPINNHHIICLGQYEMAIKEFFQQLS